MSSTRSWLPATSTRLAPEYLVDSAVLGTLGTVTTQGGPLLGLDQRENPFTLSMARPLPTRIVVVGGLYLACQLVLRAVATGVMTFVATGRPDAWEPLRLAASPPGTNASSMVQLRRLIPLELPTASAHAPLLVVHDGGATPTDLFPPRAPWQTTMTVLPYLHPQASTTANNADVVLLQRLPFAEAQSAGRIWRLPPAMVQELISLPEGQVIVLGRDLWLPLRLITSAGEQRILGPIRRGD